MKTNNSINKSYPKVLIIGHTFHQKSGSGITLSNLFMDWPEESVAIATTTFPPSSTNSLKKYSKHYFLGRNEVQLIWPFNIFYKYSPSQIIEIKEHLIKEEPHVSPRIKKSFSSKITKYLLSLTGLNICLNKYTISNNFAEWVDNFSPDIIYSALGDLGLVKFLQLIKLNTKYKVVIHIWDDWPNTIYRNTLLTFLLKIKLEKAFIDLISISDLNLCICDEMSKQYSSKYGRKFYVFHNPVDISKWNNSTEKPRDQLTYKMIYLGKINKDTDKTLLLASKAIHNLNKIGIYIQFEIYTTNISHKIIRYFPDTTIVHSQLAHSEIPSILKNCDILFLPLNFLKSSIKYTHLSMPTKVSEYMYSGTPIIVMAPPNIALTQYAKKFIWANIVDKFSQELLMEKIKHVISKVKESTDIANNAKQIAIKFHSSDVVRENFRSKLYNLNEIESN